MARSLASFIASCERIQVAGVLGQAAPLGVLDASFNPPTIAHLEFARALRGRGCALVLMLSTGNADKPAAPLADLEHRLAMVEAFARDLGGEVAIALTKEPYFIGKAEALAAALPGRRQVFAMGSDTLVRLYNQKYYTEPVNEVMGAFFSSARILVFDRKQDAVSGTPAVDLGAFAEQIERGEVVVGGTGLADVSSSQVRAAVRGAPTAAPALVPPRVAAYITAHTLYN